MTAAGDDDSDEALLAAYAQGDRRAFARLVARYERRVYGICLRYFANAADAEDAAQETFLTVMRRAETFRGASAFSTWLYRVATNTCNDMARRRSRRPPAGGALPEVADPVDVHDTLANRELGLELQAALATLDHDQRTVVVLHDVVGLGYPELATRLGIPVGTAKSRVHRAHARLALELAHLRPDREPQGLTPPPTQTP